MHYHRLALSLLLLITALTTACARAATLPPHPNIILVMPDDLGYGDYSCLGSPILKTPAADAFWKQSVRFTQFHVSPTCAPTRSALMTGRHEFKNGVTHTILERERMTLQATTLAQVLKSAGYTTGIFGKWHLGDEDAYQPGRRGFDDVYIHGGGGIGQTYPGSCGDAPGNMYFDPAIRHNGTFEKTKGYCTDVFYRQAIQWMDEKRRGKQPFFTYIALNVAHAPLQCPEENFKHYQGRVPDDVARFYGMVETDDANFGHLMQQLKDWSMEDNTLVIFLGTDNGGTYGTSIYNAGMRGKKGTPYEGGTHGPAFWRWPAAFRGGVDCDVLTAHIDIFPTLAEIAGAKLTDSVRQQVEGRSLVPLLLNPQAAWPDRFLVTHVGRWGHGKAAEAKYTACSIRNTRYSLVNNRELYDLQADPGEKTNLIEQQPEIAAKLRTAYDQWWTEVQPYLVNENVPAPKMNPFKEAYWKQFGGGPDEETRRMMDPDISAASFEPAVRKAPKKSE